MRTFVQKTTATQQNPSATAISDGAHFVQSREVDSMLRLAHDFSQIPAHPKSPASVQAKLTVGPPGDSYEQEADRVSERVLRMHEPQQQRVCACGGGCSPCQTEQPIHEPERVQTTTRRVHASETGQIAAPPVVRDVLRSPGQPLDPAARDFMEQRFGHDFGRVLIHADPAAAEAAAALGAEAFTVGRHIAFAHERFLPGTASGRRLVAHELMHTIQQAATSPYIALAPEKKQAAPAPGTLKFKGVLLGANRNKEEVRVKREVGATQGYDDRLQAIAVARMARVEPAAVVLGADGKWHALETTAGFDVGPVSANPKASEIAAGGRAQVVEVHGLPSLAAIDQARQRVADLRAKLVRLDSLEAEWKNDPEFRKAVKGADTPLPEAIEAEREKTSQNLTKANQAHAALVLGVPESEILLIATLTGRVAGKVNIVGTPGRGSPGGGHNPLGGQTEFEEGRASALHIDLPELDIPIRAQSILFHEAQHLKDWELAQFWVKNYTTETKGLFVKGAPGQKPFKDWLDAQVKLGRLTKADVELVIMQAGDASAYTEARANVRAFLAALQSGAPDAATKALVGYAHALKPKKEGGGGQYGSPAPRSEVQAALVQELKMAYGQMSTTMKQQYNVAVATAMKEHPGAWIAELDFSKRAGK
jgi:Domain of unknown function (DUF4157)